MCFFSRGSTRQPRQQESKCCHEPVHGSEKIRKHISPTVRQGVRNSCQILLMDRILHQFDLKCIRINYSDVCLPTLLGTNLSPEKPILKMIFLFPRWDMLVRWRVFGFDHYQPLMGNKNSCNLQVTYNSIISLAEWGRALNLLEDLQLEGWLIHCTLMAGPPGPRPQK